MDIGTESYRRYLDGDRDAFGAVVEAYRERLIFFLYRYVRDWATAEDLAIDAFTELIVHPQRYDFRVSLKTYLFTIGRNRALNRLRHRRALPEDAPPESITDGRTPEDTVLADERKRTLYEAIADLPPDQQTAIHLVYFEELSYDDTARVMKKSRKQIDNLLYAAKKTLRTRLRKEEWAE